jgi:hypothetical protein
MNIPVRRIEPVVMAERSAAYDAPRSDADAAVWRIEEIDAAEPEASRRTAGERWICLLIAALGALTGFGFLGRVDGGRTIPPAASPEVAASPRAEAPAEAMPLRIISPIEAATIESTVIDVQAVASRKLGTVRLAVMLGGAALGRTSVDVLEAGPFSTSIRVFAPSVRVQVELVATVGATAIRRTLWLHPGGVVRLWPVRILHPNGQATLVIPGYAPMGVGRVQVRVQTPDGRLLATAAADVGRDETDPASAGGYALGLGSFRTMVALRGLGRPGALVVLVDWRDAMGGQWGTEVQSVIDVETRSPHRRANSRRHSWGGPGIAAVEEWLRLDPG